MRWILRWAEHHILIHIYQLTLYDKIYWVNDKEYYLQCRLWNIHDIGLVNCCHFLSPMLNSKVKCILCNFCTFLLRHDFKTFNNPIYILKKTNHITNTEKDVFHLVMSLGQRKKFWVCITSIFLLIIPSRGKMVNFESS